MSWGYRDSHDARRSRLGAALEAATEREAQLRDAFWRYAAPGLREHVLSLRKAAEAGLDDGGNIDDAEAALARYDAVVSEALQGAPRLAHDLSALPMAFVDLAPQPSGLLASFFLAAPSATRRFFMGGPFVDLYTSLVDTNCEAMRRVIHAVCERDVPLTRVGAVAYRASFLVHETPITLLGQLVQEDPRTLQYEWHMAAATGVARALPPLDLVPLPFGARLLSLLGIVHRTRTGNDQFDDLFARRGGYDEPTPLLVPDVCRGLVRIAAVDVPLLTAADGVAIVRWRFDPTIDAVRAAIRVLIALRALPASVELTQASAERRNSR